MGKNDPKGTTAPVVPTIEIVKPTSLSTFTIGAGDPVAAQTEIGLWDNAAKLVSANPRNFTVNNDEDEPRNFVGGDSRRFYLRVTDLSAKGRKFLEADVEWWTSFVDNDQRTKTQDDPPSRLSMFEVSPNTGVFASKALMIVCDAVDRSVVMNSGVPKGHPLFAKHGGNRSDTQSNYRIRRGGMFSSVVASYLPKGAKTPVKSAVTPVFQKSRTKVLPVQVYIVRKTPGGAPSVDPDSVFATDLRVVTETYERIGVWTYTHVSAADAANPKIEVRTATSGLKYRACIIDPAPGLTTSKVGDNGMFQQCKAVPGDPSTLRLFYIEQFSTSKPGALLGLSFGPTYAPPPGGVFGPSTPAPEKVGASFIAGDNRDPYTAAHELGHILTDKGTNGGHYTEPSPVQGFLEEQNLMFSSSRGPKEDFDQTKRIWEIIEPGSSGIPMSQLLRIQASRFTR